MLSVEFAPNEGIDDALLSLSLLMQPWRWYKGEEKETLRKKIGLMLQAKKEDVHFFLSGRAGLFHLLKCLDVPEGSEVIVTGYTCEAVVLPVLALGLIPIYNDVSFLDCSSNPEKTPSLISKRTRVLIIQHTYGIPPRRTALLKIAAEHGLVVIEDLAHGFEKDVFLKDSVKTYKLLSFGRSKSMSSVFGGAVITHGGPVRDGMATAERGVKQVAAGELVKLLNYKPFSLLIKYTYSILGTGKLLHKALTTSGVLVPEISSREKRGEYDPYFDKDYPNALAILLSHQLEKYESTRRRRGEVVREYRKALKGVLTDDFSLARYPVLVKDREKFLREAKGYGFYPGTWYTQPVAPEGLELGKVGYRKGDCPEAEFISKHIVNLPTNIHLETARDIVELVKPHLLIRS
ncbi:MAG: DegT/DnrJ/EryC1/StrS family aminotransferase [Patescibacteria group bacterium]|nr:DegT/DnrJ/EryC1/StrS family aminotransferase [Patescibacteria group bacterium]